MEGRILSTLHPSTLGATNGRWPCAVLLFPSSTVLWAVTSGYPCVAGRYGPTKPRRRQGIEKLILPLFHSLAVGLLSLGFLPTHSLSPYLQTSLAMSCFVLVLSCCVLPLYGSHLHSFQLQT